ncbi:MAG TPA: glycoside hydrolase family 36 protein [Armatimonadota bacterium]
MRPYVVRCFAALAALSILSPKALCMYQTKTFTSKARARASFSPKTMTWTISNAAVSRSVRFNAKTGGLAPGALLLNGKPAAARVLSEGSIALVMPLSGPPAGINTGWKSTEAKPGADWTQAAFDDSGWNSCTLPFVTQSEQRSWWFRYRIPAEVMRADRSYAVVLDHSADDAAEIWADGVSLGTMPATSLPWTKTFQFMLPKSAKVVSVRLDGGGRPNGLKNISIVETGTERRLDLSRGWALTGHTEAEGTATLHLSGNGSNTGFRVDLTYRAMPGDEPVVTKRITVHSAAAQQYLLKEVVIDSFETSGPVSGTQAFTGSGYAIATKAGGGYVASALSLQGGCETYRGGRRLETVYRPYTPVAANQPESSPETMLGLYDGPTHKGGFLLQLYVGAHVSHGTPTTVPPLYSTWFGYYNTITGDLVESLVPRAASLGVKYFAVDDGWQGIKGDPALRGYGDWTENKTFFPNRLKRISEKVRANGMKFGLWTAPIMVHNQSGVSVEHPEWKILHADGSGMPLWDGTTAECFSGAYAEHFKKTLLGLCKNLDLKFLKLDGGLFQDGCVGPTHSHPVAHSEGAQIAAWKDLCATLRKDVPGVIIDRGWEGEPGLTALQDTSWYGDWVLAFHPEREADIKWWYRNADVYRRFLYGITFSRPPFTISWEAPCHILATPEDLNALEYHITSIGAYVCNLELHGRILEMTPAEAEVTRKWVKWNWANRDWLAVTQPIVSLGQPYDPMAEKSAPKLDGVMHLRNALRGRYGYVCLWNPSEKPATAKVPIRPKDYFLKMDTATVSFTRIKYGTSVSAVRGPGEVTISVPMAPLSWEIVEVRA